MKLAVCVFCLLFAAADAKLGSAIRHQRIKFYEPVIYWEGPFNGSDLMSRQALQDKLFEVPLDAGDNVIDLAPIAIGENVSLRKAYTLERTKAGFAKAKLFKEYHPFVVPVRPSADVYKTFLRLPLVTYLWKQSDLSTKNEVIRIKARFDGALSPWISAEPMRIVPGKSLIRTIKEHIAATTPYFRIYDSIAGSAQLFCDGGDGHALHTFPIGEEATAPIYELVKYHLMGCASATIVVNAS